jgi:hypothetical protein
MYDECTNLPICGVECHSSDFDEDLIVIELGKWLFLDCDFAWFNDNKPMVSRW